MCSSTNEPRPLLLMQDVARWFLLPSGRVDAVRKADLRLDAGEFVTLTGPSGSGKSTLLHIAALLDRPSAGRVVFDGRDASALAEEERCAVRKSQVGMVFQRHCLLPHRSAIENVQFRFRYLDRDRGETERLALAALETVGIGELRDRPVRLLSGGEMQRVAIARAIAFRPTLLIADEPTGNLDASSSGAVMECFEALNRSGIAILMVTHDPSILGTRHRTIACRNGCVNG